MLCVGKKGGSNGRISEVFFWLPHAYTHMNTQRDTHTCTRGSSIKSAFLLLVADLVVGLQTELYLRAVISLEYALVLSSKYLLDFPVRSVFFGFRNMTDKSQYCSSADFTPM